jgi:hypothetical protein
VNRDDGGYEAGLQKPAMYMTWTRRGYSVLLGFLSDVALHRIRLSIPISNRTRHFYVVIIISSDLATVFLCLEIPLTL